MKSLLALMLTVTQLLAGAGDIYLCISRDGAFCCLDAGPEGCECCRPDAEVEVSEQDCSRDCGCGHHHRAQLPADGIFLSEEPCDCTHILISSEQPSVVVRTSDVVENERIRDLLAWSPKLVGNPELNAAADRPPIRYGPAGIVDDHLALLATVVIRC